MGNSGKRATDNRLYHCLLAINGRPAQPGIQSRCLRKTHNPASDPKDLRELQKLGETGQLVPGAEKPKKHQLTNSVFLETFYQLCQRGVLLHV